MRLGEGLELVTSGDTSCFRQSGRGCRVSGGGARSAMAQQHDGQANGNHGRVGGWKRSENETNDKLTDEK